MDLKKISTTHICDAEESILPLPALKPVHKEGEGIQLVGKAFTVESQGDVLPIFKALEEASPGDVLVVDAQCTQLAVAGEIFSREAQKKGIKGIVVLGHSRDGSEIKTLNFPFYSRGLVPKVGSKNKAGTLRCPLEYEGIKIEQGDLIFGDDNGVLVIPHQQKTEVLEKANNIATLEERIIEYMNTGSSLASLTNIAEVYPELIKGESAAFRFELPSS